MIARPSKQREGRAFFRPIDRKGGNPVKIIHNDGRVAECPAEDELHVIRHSAAHILAQAVKHLCP